MKKLFAVVLAAGAVFVFAAAGSALEKTTVQADRDVPTGWDASATCSVYYANVCTGWLWIWSQWVRHDVLGVVLDPCCSNGQLTSTQVYFWTGAPSGWGFTGVVTVSSVVDDCPGTPYGSYAYLPPFPDGGTNVHTWSGIPPGPVTLTYRAADPGSPSPMSVPTDHPAAGPTGPQACGLCYPTTRQTHSYYWGTTDSPLCPGVTFSDGVCDAELLGWGGSFTCMTPIESKGWGAIKNLYR